MIDEVRRQFREIPGIMEGTGTARLRALRRRSRPPRALKQMVLPGVMAVVTFQSSIGYPRPGLWR